MPFVYHLCNLYYCYAVLPIEQRLAGYVAELTSHGQTIPGWMDSASRAMSVRVTSVRVA